jgi:hypothetical protein
MKSIALTACILCLAVALPAQAETAHRSSVTHEGRTVALSYEPKLETTFRQVDIGPRAFPRCIWTTKVAVQRTAFGADNRPIAALTRLVGEEAKPRRGSDLGHCSALSRQDGRSFGVSTAELQAMGADAARDDAAALHTEIASLGTFHPAFAR